MRVVIGLVLTCLVSTASAQSTAKPNVEADRLGRTCTQILEMTSTEWATYFGQKTHLDVGNAPDSTLRANAAYGKCYDARTDAVASTVLRSGRGPSKASRADFAEFEAALKDFTAKALADTQQSANSQKQSYAALYERQFRYAFYRSYGLTRAVPSAPKPRMLNPNEASSAQRTPPAGAGNTSRDRPDSSAMAGDSDEMSKAKNRFGELLGALPDDKLHDLHAAFGEVVGLHALDDEMRLAVYRYATFLLEPSTGESSYPPPF